MVPSIVSPTAVMVTAAPADVGAAGVVAGAASGRVVSVPVRLSASISGQAARPAVPGPRPLAGVPAGLVSLAGATVVAAGWPKCRPPEQAGSASRAAEPTAAPRCLRRRRLMPGLLMRFNLARGSRPGQELG